MRLLAAFQPFHGGNTGSIPVRDATLHTLEPPAAHPTMRESFGRLCHFRSAVFIEAVTEIIMFKRFISSTAAALAFVFLLAASISAQTPQNRDVVVVLPFENTSAQGEYNWVGASFADALSDLLSVPGIVTISSDERELAYQRLRLPLTTLPSRATTIKVGREARATMALVGKYTVTPPRGENEPATVQGTAQVIRVNEGRFTGETMLDGRWALHQYDFGGALTNLQTMQGRLAYQILYQRDKALAYSLNQFVERATKIPPRAFEAYVKGVATTDTARRSAYLQNAMLEFERTNAGAVYTQAAFELGSVFFRQGDWQRAADNFIKVLKRDHNYAEAAFYAGLAYWRMNDMSNALGMLTTLASEKPLTAVYNNTGAISVQAARIEKNAGERQRLLTQAASFLSRAAESAPDDPLVRFNYALALFTSGKVEDAVEQLRPVIAANPRDGEALFLFAKGLERTNRAEAATAADNEARRYLPNYAKLQTAWQLTGALEGISPRLYQELNRYALYTFERRRNDEAAQPARANASDLLSKSRELYRAGRDDEALPELRRVLTIEPMNAEAYLLIGRINQRRGDTDASISALKTAIFWDARMTDAHIMLGRIFFERNDRAQARAFAKNAVQLDPNNQEAVALMRQVETGAR